MTIELTNQLSRAYKVVKPITEHAVRWILIAFGLFFVLLEIDYASRGAVYRAWQWIWMAVIAKHPSVVFMLGMLTSYLIMRHRMRKMVNGQFEGGTSPGTSIRMSVADLAAEASKMGVEMVFDPNGNLVGMKKKGDPPDAGAKPGA